MAAFSAAMASRAFVERLIAFPTTRRDQASKMAAISTNPVAIAM
jgi:hypothetical protein